MKFQTARRWLASAMLATSCAALVAPTSTHAQSDKLTRFILPVAAGSGVDTIMRASQKALSASLGTAVVIDNQPGAGGIVGTQTLVKAAPDGATLSVVSNNHVIYPSVYKTLPFDPIRDITPIAVIGGSPMVLVVNPKVPANNLKELVALLKANPGKYNYGSAGNGTILHLAAEMFLDEAGVTAKHIPYKGVGPMVTDLIGGQVPVAFDTLDTLLPQAESGKLRRTHPASTAETLRRETQDQTLRDNVTGLYQKIHFEDQLRREVLHHPLPGAERRRARRIAEAAHRERVIVEIGRRDRRALGGQRGAHRRTVQGRMVPVYADPGEPIGPAANGGTEPLILHTGGRGRGGRSRGRHRRLLSMRGERPAPRAAGHSGPHAPRRRGAGRSAQARSSPPTVPRCRRHRHAGRRLARTLREARPRRGPDRGRRGDQPPATHARAGQPRYPRARTWTTPWRPAPGSDGTRSCDASRSAGWPRSTWRA